MYHIIPAVVLLTRNFMNNPFRKSLFKFIEQKSNAESVPMMCVKMTPLVIKEQGSVWAVEKYLSTEVKNKLGKLHLSIRFEFKNPALFLFWSRM